MTNKDEFGLNELGRLRREREIKAMLPTMQPHKPTLFEKLKSRVPGVVDAMKEKTKTLKIRTASGGTISPFGGEVRLRTMRDK